PACRNRRALARRPVPLPRLPQAPRRTLPRLGDLPGNRRDGDGRDTRLPGPALLPALRLAGLRPFGRRGGGEPRHARRARPVPADLRALDRPARELAATLPATQELRAQPRDDRPDRGLTGGGLTGGGLTGGADARAQRWSLCR